MTDSTSSIDTLLGIMSRLRDPQGGCPWDLQQDFSTIAPYTIEEAYEVADAIARADMEDLKDELGDLLLQVVFHAQMASERGAFGFADVVRAISEKMVRRHPHVFADAEADSADAVMVNWNEIKRAERAAKGELDTSALAGVAHGLPEWQRAQKLQSRASRVGFDWPGPEAVLGKLQEEVEEVRVELDKGDVADNRARLEDEIGDVLFVCASLARHAGVDVGAALRHANRKFERRFRGMEQLAMADGGTLQGISLQEQDAYWARVKYAERGDEP